MRYKNPGRQHSQSTSTLAGKDEGNLKEAIASWERGTYKNTVTLACHLIAFIQTGSRHFRGANYLKGPKVGFFFLAEQI